MRAQQRSFIGGLAKLVFTGPCRPYTTSHVSNVIATIHGSSFDPTNAVIPTGAIRALSIVAVSLLGPRSVGQDTLVPNAVFSCMLSASLCEHSVAYYASVDVDSFAVTRPGGDLLAEGPVFFPMSSFVDPGSEYVDSLRNVLYSFQLARYGLVPWRNATCGSPRRRIIFPDIRGTNTATLDSLHGKRYRCTLIVDSVNAFFIGRRSDPFVQRKEVSARKVERLLEQCIPETITTSRTYGLDVQIETCDTSGYRYYHTYWSKKLKKLRRFLVRR